MAQKKRGARSPLRSSAPLQTSHKKDRHFLALVWADFRPYLVMIVVDALIAVSLWLSLWVFHHFTHLVPLDNEIANFIVNLHGVGVVAAFALFIGLFINDVFMHKKGGRHEN
jgi:hypothetical protein